MPLFIAVDQEGGKVRRLKPPLDVPDMPSAQILGEQSPKAIFEAGLNAGKALNALGITMNFSPVADIAVNSASPAVAIRSCLPPFLPPW